MARTMHRKPPRALPRRLAAFPVPFSFNAQVRMAQRARNHADNWWTPRSYVQSPITEAGAGRASTAMPADGGDHAEQASGQPPQVRAPGLWRTWLMADYAERVSSATARGRHHSPPASVTWSPRSAVATEFGVSFNLSSLVAAS